MKHKIWGSREWEAVRTHRRIACAERRKRTGVEASSINNQCYDIEYSPQPFVSSLTLKTIWRLKLCEKIKNLLGTILIQGKQEKKEGDGMYSK